MEQSNINDYTWKLSEFSLTCIYCEQNEKYQKVDLEKALPKSSAMLFD